MKSIRTVNRYLVKVVLFTVLLMIIVGSFTIQQAHADEFDGYQGTLNGSVPAVTRNVATGKLFSCNAYLVLHKRCSVTSVSPDGNYALVHIVGDSTCPNGMYGLINRNTGNSLSVIPKKSSANAQQICRGNFKVGFVRSESSFGGYAMAVYYNNKTVETLEDLNRL
ncbi:hypothetical protein MLDJOKPK_00259 [Salmonella phage SPAsTU]|nr:hypothetical protein STsAS_155 [Salmonella phage STsAS]AXF51126.1 hypothetical protein MLDJOKPK_00259 [Salmonella phage SPAsTU]